MAFVFECGVGQFQLTGPFNEDLLRAVHENIVDRVVLQKRFKRTKAGHFVIKVLIQRLTLFAVQNNAHFVERFAGNGDDLGAEIVFRGGFQRAEVEVVQKTLVQLKLDLAEPLFAFLFLVDRRSLSLNAAHLAALYFRLWRRCGRFFRDREISLTAGNTFQLWLAGCPTLIASFLIL